MEPEKVDVGSDKKVTFIVLAIALAVFIVYFVIMSMLGPGFKLIELQEEYRSKTQIDSTLDKRIFTDSTYLKLLKERAFLLSRTIMAETDSIYLTINLSDSAANIEISGVIVHAAKISEIHASSIFLKGDENIVLNILATPFTIVNSFATIKKEPVMLKMAPKDTSEYKPDIMPDTSITESVNFVLEMSNGTHIIVYQKEDDKFSDRRSQFWFDLKYRLRDTWSSLKSVARFKVPEYHPYIKIRLPRSDAKIFYRALPKRGQIAVSR